MISGETIQCLPGETPEHAFERVKESTEKPRTPISVQPDPLPGLIEQALGLIPQMPESDAKKELMESTADAITRQIDNAMNPLMFVNPEKGTVVRVET